MEVREIFTEQIMELFKENIRKNGEAVNVFCAALKNGDAEGVEKGFMDYLRKTISIRDTFVKKPMKENFHPKGAPTVYHGILLGLLGYQDAWGISSARWRFWMRASICSKIQGRKKLNFKSKIL